jgi:eukaryotic-like serine/threonine-protein kinase
MSPNTTIAQYSIVSKIGEGGMGEVWRARDTKLGRDVAIKVLPAVFSANAERLRRFEQEAQAAGALNHPNILVIFHIGTHQGAPYIVSELLEGETLRERMAGAALPQRKALDYALQIARGLAAAHEKGIVHRDIKPDNVFVTNDGRVKILDFGLAKLSGASETQSQTEIPTRRVDTDPGTVMGTMGYMSPEQLKGQPADHRSDIFSFGAILYEMLSGKRAFRGNSMAETMSAILREDPPDLSETNKTVAPALERIVRHCMEKNPAERFRSASDLGFALESLSGSQTGTVLSGAAAIDAGGPARRPRAGLVMAAAVAGALVLGASAGYLGRGRSAPASAGVAEITYKPVTFENGFVFTARFAPDGRTIVYSADWDRQPRGVYVTSLDSPEYRPLGFQGADLLGISSSGELAILNGSIVTGGDPYWRIGTLAKASLTGGAARAELEGVRFADFGPNNTMAVIREDARRQTMEYPVGQVLAEVPIVKSSQSWTGRSDYAAPRVSPSGDYVAFFDIQVRSAYRVKIFDRSGKFVTESQPFSDWWALAWTPSNEVWFAAAEASGTQTTMFSLDLAGHQRAVFRAPGSITLHDISTQGNVLVSFDRGTDRVELVGGPDPTPQDRSWRESSRVGAFSNSHTLLINGNGDSGGPHGSVYVWQPKEAQPVRIADGSGVALSPDGSKALVVSLQTPPKISIVPTGAGQPQVVDIGPVEFISWAGWLPDGRLVIQAVRPGSGPAVYVISAAGRDPVALLPAGVTLRGTGNNLISPDGSRIVAVDAAGQFMACTIATPACRPVPGMRDGDVVAGWSADGQSLFVSQPQPVQVQVDRLEVASGHRSAWKTVRPLNPAVSGLTVLIVSSDGTVAYGYSKGASQLYVIKGLK